MKSKQLVKEFVADSGFTKLAEFLEFHEFLTDCPVQRYKLLQVANEALTQCQHKTGAVYQRLVNIQEKLSNDS